MSTPAPPSDQAIRVEFYGLARRHAGTSLAWFPAGGAVRLSDLWRTLQQQYPGLAADKADRRFAASLYRINVDGERFVTDLQTKIQAGQCVLIMSADAGG